MERDLLVVIESAQGLLACFGLEFAVRHVLDTMGKETPRLSLRSGGHSVVTIGAVQREINRHGQAVIGDRRIRPAVVLAASC